MGRGAEATVTIVNADAAHQESGATVGVPGDIAASAAGASRIDVSWTATSGDPTGYQVEWSADGNGGWHGSVPRIAARGPYSDTGLAAGRTRNCRVRAVNGGGTGVVRAGQGHDRAGAG